MDKILFKYWVAWKLLSYLWPSENDKYIWLWYKNAYSVRKQELAIKNHKLGKKCLKCGSRTLNKATWSRSHDLIYGGDHGSYGSRCYDCGHIEFEISKENYEKSMSKNYRVFR